MSVTICKFCGPWVGVVSEGSGGGSWVWVNVVGKKKYRNKELKKKVVKFLKKDLRIRLSPKAGYWKTSWQLYLSSMKCEC